MCVLNTLLRIISTELTGGVTHRACFSENRSITDVDITLVAIGLLIGCSCRDVHIVRHILVCHIGGTNEYKRGYK